MSAKLWRNALVWPSTRVEMRQALSMGGALLLLGAAYALAVWRFAAGQRGRIETLVAGFLVFELVLHLVYGDTPFLYAFHYVPFLILFLVFQLPRSIAAAWLLLVTIAVQGSTDWSRFLEVFG
jgi:hypothetical protein